MEAVVRDKDVQLQEFVQLKAEMMNELFQSKVREEQSANLKFKVEFLEKELKEWKERYDLLLRSRIPLPPAQDTSSNPRTP